MEVIARNGCAYPKRCRGLIVLFTSWWTCSEGLFSYCTFSVGLFSYITPLNFMSVPFSAGEPWWTRIDMFVCFCFPPRKKRWVQARCKSHMLLQRCVGGYKRHMYIYIWVRVARSWPPPPPPWYGPPSYPAVLAATVVVLVLVLVLRSTIPT